ncbi:MAG: aspartyl/glutamyl-tRNA amidotransferase subunit C [Treponema sp.]|jgi:aspartyl-tRNA(Asn)/glutamyl-tRNA(Gln) amidotransferase subunit C|nr:aspartyl/glutamyl-tRNA amidotransferase subunit C [Treponema sp.]
MKIEDLQETVQLAHLTMNDQELAQAFPAFEEMLGFFTAMQAADEDAEAFPPGNLNGNPMDRDSLAALTVTSRHFRQDNPDTDNLSQSLNENLLDNAGERDGNFVVVPNVL